MSRLAESSLLALVIWLVVMAADYLYAGSKQSADHAKYFRNQLVVLVLVGGFTAVALAQDLLG